MTQTRRTVAVTGATGFLGRQAVAALAAKGWQVRVLLRAQPLHPLWQAIEPEVVLGSLADTAALERLVTGCDAVLHMAGLIKARNEAEFMAVNRDGSKALADASRRLAPKAHFLQVSSLAAREPQLSGYAASKQAGERAVLDALSPQQLSIVRPPAIYGPGDRETLIFFQLARQPLVPLLGRPEAKLAVIHVEDAASALAAQLETPACGEVRYIADDRPEGYSWRDILDAAAAAVGNQRPRYVQVPKLLLRGAAYTSGTLAQLTGQVAMLNGGKLRELLHADWSVPADKLLQHPASPARRKLLEGFKATAEWYRKVGWLRPD